MTRQGTLEQRGLAVIDTSEEDIGCVIKRVDRIKDQWVLVSSHPVEPHEPMTLSGQAISAVWPLHGVLFKSAEFKTSGAD